MDYSFAATHAFLANTTSGNAIKLGVIRKLYIEHGKYINKCEVYIFADMTTYVAVVAAPISNSGAFCGGTPEVNSFCLVTEVEGILDKVILCIISNTIKPFGDMIEHPKPGEQLVRSGGGGEVRVTENGEVHIVTRKRGKKRETVATIKIGDNENTVEISTLKHQVLLNKDGSIQISSNNDIKISSEGSIQISSKEDIDITSEKVIRIKGEKTKIQSGKKGVARIGDKIMIDPGAITVICPATGAPTRNITPVIGKILEGSKEVLI